MNQGFLAVHKMYKLKRLEESWVFYKKNTMFARDK